MRVERHLAWFRLDTGYWLGEWRGAVPAPTVPPELLGEARLQFLNAWLQRVQQFITPAGAPWDTQASVWNEAAWDDCPPGGAVCLDVSMYGWPVGDFRWAVFDGVDRLLDFRDQRTYLQLRPATARIDAHGRSPRPIRSTPDAVMADVTGTPLEPVAGHLLGQWRRHDGRLVWVPDDAHATLPDPAMLSLAGPTPVLALLEHYSAIPLA